MQKTYVIIGASAAGISAAAKLRQLDVNARIVCISDEHEPPYNKCFLVDYLSNQKEFEQLFLKPQDFFSKNGIELKLGLRVVALDCQKKKVICVDGSAFEYTKLLLGLGGGGLFCHPLKVSKTHRVFLLFIICKILRLLKHG